jgi:hypothetical protein
MGYVCPVCGFPELDEPPRSPVSGGGSYEICPSCGFEFGVTDDDRGYTYDAWRRKWVAEGTPWTDAGVTEPPPGWDPRKQLRAVAPGEE